MTPKPIEQLELGRKTLKRDMLFRTVKGTGPSYGSHRLGPFSTFIVKQLYAARTRVTCDCIDTKTGQSHTLYIQGPRYREGDAVREPFKIKL